MAPSCWVSPLGPKALIRCLFLQRQRSSRALVFSMSLVAVLFIHWDSTVKKSSLFLLIDWSIEIKCALTTFLLFDGCNLGLSLFQLGPLRAPPNWLHCSFDMAPSFFQTCIYFLVPRDVLGFSCIFLLTALESTLSPRSLGPFCWRTAFRISVWALGVLITAGLSLFLGPLSRQSPGIRNYMLTHVDPQSSVALSVHLHIH